MSGGRCVEPVVTLCDGETVNLSQNKHPDLLGYCREENQGAAANTSCFFLRFPLSGLKRCSMRKDEILPQQRVVGSPFCELCKSQMWLACIEPDEPGHDKRTFECPGCPNVTVRIVKYRATGASRSSQLDAWYSTWQRTVPIRPLAEVQMRQPASPSDRPRSNVRFRGRATSRFAPQMSAFDPKRTLAMQQFTVVSDQL